ncbi:HI1506-related protein [Pseudomonas qingdaonensis]|nr:HI1506-related protein [Pseudomonas qingdaonensis]
MGVVIKAVTDGFRRGGIVHHTRGKFYPDGYFTEAQLAQLKAEPQLLVTEQEEPGLPDDQGELIQELGATIAQLEYS